MYFKNLTVRINIIGPEMGLMGFTTVVAMPSHNCGCCAPCTTVIFGSSMFSAISNTLKTDNDQVRIFNLTSISNF